MAPGRRASTLKTSIEGHEELQKYLKGLSIGQNGTDAHPFEARFEAAHLVQQSLLTSPLEAHARDAFRHLGGFHILLDVLQDITNLYHSPHTTSKELPLLQELLQTAFAILAIAFHNHEGNQRYFRERVQDNGWSTVRILLIRLLNDPVDRPASYDQMLCERVFGCLLTCALDDESVIALFSTLPSAVEKASNDEVRSLDGNADSVKTLALASIAPETSDRISRVLGTSTHIHLAEPLGVMFDLWKSLEALQLAQPAVLIVPHLLNRLANTSTSNLLKLHETGMLDSLLSNVLKIDGGIGHLNDELFKLTKSLLSLGVSKLENAHSIFHSAKSSCTTADLLLSSLTASKTPPFVHFDLSLHGYASIELPGTAQSFPPMSNSDGYTLSLWFHVVKYDPNAHTTLFGAFDASQACFVLVYLEKDTHNLILQTSIKSSRPSVRFKSISFNPGHWYYVTLVHKRPRTTSSSKASLFVDGEFVEQVKSQYPSLPPKVSPESKYNGNTLGYADRSPVQNFLGTPQDLASRLGRDLVKTEWRLASAQLFAETLSDDLIAVYFRLSPRYTGNFQDCLGSFQTYDASAQLNLRNESLHPGREEKSDLVSAIRSKAGELLSESKILLNISATNIYGNAESSSTNEVQPLHSLSRTAHRNFLQVSQGGRNPIALNGAFPSYDQALLRASGHAIVTGQPTVINKGFIDNAAWQLGGATAVCLALVDSAEDPDSLVRNLEIFFSTIQDDWRNSEAVERDNGFGILANILTAKFKIFDAEYSTQHIDTSLDGVLNQGRPSLRCLYTILDFVGYRRNKREDSIINNPLAYRVLLVDFDLWRQISSDVQKIYYEQFFTFVEHSKYQAFNIKRLTRMRIVKKWLEALRYQQFSKITFEYFLNTFKLLVMRNFTGETMRSLALYVTYAIYEPESHILETARRRGTRYDNATSSRRKTISSTSPGNTTPTESSDMNSARLSRLQVAMGVLKIYAEMLCQRNDKVFIDRFARTVTNKWLLYLLADAQPPVMVFATNILGRLLVISGPQYVRKFVEKTGGVNIMRHWLQRHWNLPALWLVCFSVLFGKDVADVDFASFDLFTLIEMFGSGTKKDLVCPEILPIITAMLRNGLLAVTREQTDPAPPEDSLHTSHDKATSRLNTHDRQRSLTVDSAASKSPAPRDSPSTFAEGATLMRTVTRFLADIHSKSPAFRDLAATSNYIQELFLIIYPIVVSSSTVSAETELQARDSALTFKGEDVAIKPLALDPSRNAPIVRTTTPDSSHKRSTSKPQPPRRISSYVLVASNETKHKPKLQPAISPKRPRASSNVSNALVQEILELVLAVFCDQIFWRKDFPGLGLFMRVPPGFQEHQAYFETFILRNALSHIGNSIKLDQKLLWEPRVLTNLARLASHLGEAIYEGWFIDGANDTFDFLANILEYLQLSEISSIKSVRLCSNTIESIRSTLHRIILLRLSELDEDNEFFLLVNFLDKLAYWQSALLSTHETTLEFLRFFVYLLYTRLDSMQTQVKMGAANLLRLLLVHKYDDVSLILQQAEEHAGERAGDTVAKSFKKIMELDNETFVAWYTDNRSKTDSLFVPLSKNWARFVADENRRTEETARARIGKRRERLKVWAADDLRKEDLIQRHEASSEIWRSNIYTTEHLKRQRVLQDQQDTKVFNNASWAKMYQGLCRPGGLFENEVPLRWRLDETEGRNRMRMRFVPDMQPVEDEFRPKRRQSGLSTRKRTSLSATPTDQNPPPLPDGSQRLQMTKGGQTTKVNPEIEEPNADNKEDESDEEFEMVDDPRGELEEYEDKNRKVMRSIQRGDQVEYVHNASRIVGLEAVEGLLIGGKLCLYLLDNLFQRLDGEIVDVIQAPEDERDPYLRMISGHKASRWESTHSKAGFETRSWRWDEILSISKRRFLFRDVAMEVFFVDGQSFLLTTRNPASRDELYQKLHNRAVSSSGRTSLYDEDSWRVEALRHPDEASQSLSTRFTNVFAHQVSNPATRKWMKGEISNFHYLMLVNTMAGRTFNDLTQYPVFPWVLSDYTSDELDLSDPRIFRDLTKPMGCQTHERQADFQDRYQSFAEMGDENAPPFHYGTHYSSAMIVTSYLIRLQPFVHSYLLLQGGFFDHADRLFYSIEKAWNSAAKENMTDVRELIPEFYYLPEFLTNMNGYDLGQKQANGERIDSVTLPPWAKNDPKIFIAKHREALESDYVSQNLHAWIDLVFGHKQRGEAAVESTNVFHHLSYHGAKDLDTIDDPIERLATIGIIHNFGQTPHQVFYRSHPAHEMLKSMPKRLDTAAETLTRLPFPVLESHEGIASLHWSFKHEKLLSSGPRGLIMGPLYEKYMEWGFFDGSIRFFAAESRKLIGLFEHIHISHISTALFADSKTLITAGTDCTISVWSVISTSKAVDLQPKKTLFGHREPITTLAVSRSFSTLLSASSDGQVILWDLNRTELVRVLTAGKPVECARINDVTGNILLCRASEISIWSLNGELIIQQDVYVEGDDMISSCAFFEGNGNEHLEKHLVFTGHKRGVVNIWSMAIRDGSFVLEHVKRMHHMDQAGFNIGATITAILPMVQTVYTGDDDGRVYEWDCIQRQ